MGIPRRNQQDIGSGNSGVGGKPRLSFGHGESQYMPGHFTAHLEAGHHISGIIWPRPGTSLGRIIEELYLIWAASTAEEYQDGLLFIPL